MRLVRPDKAADLNAIIYSAIYGGYDEPKPFPYGLDVPAVMITDNLRTAHQASVLGWYSFVVPHGIVTTKGNPAKLAPMLAHKWWKTHPGQLRGLSVKAARGGCAMAALAMIEAAEIALWVDGSIAIDGSPYGARCLQALGSDDIAFTRHPWRDCALAEGDYSATLARYADTRVKEQTDFYRGFHPRRWGLIATGAIAWRINPLTRAFGEVWWDEQLNWSHQDQVSLPILLRLADEHQLAPLEGANLAWNMNLPWERWWSLANHAVAP